MVAYLPLLMINHYIMWLDIPVHYAFAVAEIQRLQQLVDVIPDVVVLEFGIQTPEVGVVDIFENKGWCFTLCDVG